MAATAAIMVTLACGSADDPAAPEETAPAMPASGTGTVQIGGRDVTVHVPGSYDPARPAPLVMMLHGYGSYGQEQESYLQLTPQSERAGFIYVYPDGTTDDRGKRFWNATDACCSITRGPDDAEYLSELISTIQGAYRIDPSRVYLIGHSNGGFMSFRMACSHADQVTAIVSLAGATYADSSRCHPSEPVSVLAIHGTADESIKFGGGRRDTAPYPSAARTVALWVQNNKCTGTGRDAPRLDLVNDVPGAETSVRVHQGCAGGSTVQAWTINGGTHIPLLSETFAPAVIDFLLAQTKPAR